MVACPHFSNQIMNAKMVMWVEEERLRGREERLRERERERERERINK